MGGVADFLPCVILALLGACTCCSSTVGALFIVALVLGVALDVCCPADVVLVFLIC